MKSRVVFPSLLLCASLLLISACGGGKPTSAEGTLEASSASSIANAYGKQMVSGAQPSPSSSIDSFTSSNVTGARRIARSLAVFPQYRGIAAHLEHAERGSCDPTITGTTTDADGDGIPVSATYTFDCTIAVTRATAAERALSLKIAGSFTLADQDDTAATGLKSGFTLRIANVTLTMTGTSRATFDVAVSISGDLSATVAGKVITLAGEIALDIAGTYTTRASTSANASIKFFSEAVFTATDENNPFKGGGTVKVNNAFQIKTEAMNFSILITSEDLTYGTCARPSTEVTLKSGTLIAAAATGKMKIKFLTCGVPSYFFVAADGTETAMTVTNN